MRYVLDASVALKWVLVETDTPKALGLRSAFRQQTHEFLAPDVFPAEVGHALARAERRKVIQPPQGTILLADVFATCPFLHRSFPDLVTRAFAIASQMRVGVYDSLYVALAERENCEFMTADDRLVRMLQPHFPFIVPLASLP